MSSTLAFSIPISGDDEPHQLPHPHHTRVERHLSQYRDEILDPCSYTIKYQKYQAGYAVWELTKYTEKSTFQY